MKANSWPRGHACTLSAVLCCVVSLGGCSEKIGHSPITAPVAKPTEVFAREHKMTPAEIDAFLRTYDTSFARQMRGTPFGGPSKLLVPGDGTGGPESMVTETGTVSGWTTTHAEAVSNLGNAAAAWAAITQVTSGFARRVFLQSQGDYSQIWIGYPQISNLKRISDVCGEAFTDLFRQRCELGTIYTDLDCYSGNGHIFVQSQHAATFGVITSKTVTTDPSVSRSTCFPDNTSGSGGGDTCNDYQFIDETDPSGGSTDCSGSGGGGSGDSPGISGGSSSLCYDLELDPGCYDVYVDDVYDSTICC